MSGSWFVVLLTGKGAGDRVPLSGDRITIGRRAGQGLVLSDPSISGSHCELHRKGTRWHLRDLGSTNGTFVGGAKVTEVEIGAGTEFVVGTVRLKLELQLGPPAAPPPIEEHGGAASAAPSSATAPSGGEELDFVEDEPAKVPAAALEVAEALEVPSAPPTSPSVAAMPSATMGDATAALATVTDASVRARAETAAAEAARKGRVATLALGAAALVAVAMGVYFTFFTSGPAATRTKPIEAVAGNLLPSPFASMEFEPEDGIRKTLQWQLADSSLDAAAGRDEADTEDRPRQRARSDAEARFYAMGFTTKRSRSGARALEVRFEGPGWARATAEPISVQPGETYRFAVYADASGASGALVQLVFRSRLQPLLRLVRSGGFLSSREGGNGFRRIEGTALAPSGCDLVQLSLVGVGTEGVVSFDDVEIVRSPEPLPRPVQRKDLDFEFDGADGRIRKIDRDLIQAMGVLVARADGSLERTLFSSRGEDGRWTFHAPQGDVASVQLTARATEARVELETKIERPSEGDLARRRIALTWGISRAYAPEVLLRTDRTTSRHRGDFDVPSTSALVLGAERERLRVSFSPPVALRGIVEGELLRLVWEPPAQSSLDIQFSFEDEKRRAIELEHQADTADREGRIGDAITLRSQIIEEFPFEAALLDRNQAKRDARILEGQKVVARLERAVADADLFRIPGALRLAKAQAEELLSSYRGTDVAERAEAVMRAVDQTLAEVEAELGEREALRLKTIASAFAASQAADLATHIRDYIKKHFTATRAAASLGGQ